MPILTVVSNGAHLQIDAILGETLLTALQRAGLREPEALCGGNGTCGKCLVTANGQVSPAEAKELDLLNGDSRRLACYATVCGDCTVELERAGAGAVIACEGSAVTFPLAPPALQSAGGLGVAIDIGTTTVVCYLYDLSTGQRLGLCSGMNTQRAFGADVISRINHAITSTNGLEQMKSTIRDQIAGYVSALCQQADRSTDEVLDITIAGNTIMEHIFAGISPASIAVAPFTPLSLFGESAAATAFGMPGSPKAQVWLAPAVAGYVGGDITAGILACGAYRDQRPVLFLDIGTNGEMALGTAEGFLTCATAAGPAFEGAEISCGMSGVNGAISKVWLERDVPHFSVIGDTAPKGICGSGLVDALAVLLALGAVDETGRLLPPDEAPDKLAPWLEETDDGCVFWLDRDQGICITEGDVRKLQLAKAAIAAGIQTLLEAAELTEDDVETLYLAGGFGSYIDRERAADIGLLPASLLSRTRSVGNSAGAGAIAALLSDSARAEVSLLQKKCRYIELSNSPTFTEHYVACMMFE